MELYCHLVENCSNKYINLPTKDHKIHKSWVWGEVQGAEISRNSLNDSEVTFGTQIKDVQEMRGCGGHSYAFRHMPEIEWASRICCPGEKSLFFFFFFLTDSKKYLDKHMGFRGKRLLRFWSPIDKLRHTERKVARFTFLLIPWNKSHRGKPWFWTNVAVSYLVICTW